MKYNTIIVKREGAIEWVTLNRPDALNAMNSVLIWELTEYFTALKKRTEIRVVALRGSGRLFCAGLDLEDPFKDSVEESLNLQREIRNIIVAMRQCPQPIISLIHGAAAGGGFSLALASDIRIATRSTKMNCAYIRVGLGGADIASSYFLPRLVGASIASELILTGKYISAERAFQVGLLSQIVESVEDLEEAAREDIDLMVTASPLGLRLTKDALNINIDASSLDAVLAVEDRNQILMTQTPDFKEGVEAFLEKRRPKWASE